MFDLLFGNKAVLVPAIIVIAVLIICILGYIKAPPDMAYYYLWSPQEAQNPHWSCWCPCSVSGARR